MAGLSGILPTIWARFQNWDKDTQRALFQIFNLSILSLSLVVQTVTGLFGAELLQAILFALPGTILGAWIGRICYDRLATPGFNKIVLLVLAMSGLVLLATS